MKSASGKKEFDVAIVGGGIVGTSIAYGLLKAGKSVLVLDENDTSFRASRGNFGLVWRQSKGHNNEDYARITRDSVRSWKSFASDLLDLTGTDCVYKQSGGLLLAANEVEFEQLCNIAEQLKKQCTDNSYEYEIYGRAKLKMLYPGIGENVPGATYTADDGTCNPLLLLRALYEALFLLGGVYVSRVKINNIEPGDAAGFRIGLDGQGIAYECEQVVLAAGLGNRYLGKYVGLKAPVKPVAGQILVTEQLREVDFLPCNVFRSNPEGSLLIGMSENAIGYDITVDLPTSGMIAKRAIEIFPWLGKLNIVRMWSALRIMTPDGYPIYQQSESFPGAFLVTCHSGITLAAFHADKVAGAIVSGAIPADLNAFQENRFDV